MFSCKYIFCRYFNTECTAKELKCSFVLRSFTFYEHPFPIHYCTSISDLYMDAPSLNEMQFRLFILRATKELSFFFW